MNAKPYTELIPTPKDFERAFHHADRLLLLQVQCDVLDNKMTPGIGNDTVAALRQARDLVRTMHEVGVTIHDLQRWLVEWGREWKAEEELKIEIEKLKMEPT
jgi:hypothetical protein